jgi:putative oxidoreductase
MKNKIFMGVRILFAIMMINSGLNKFFNFMPMPEMAEAAGNLMGAFFASGYIFPLVAIVEVLAGALIFTKKFNALGAVLMMPITVNIFLVHTVLDPAGFIMGLVLLLINLWILIENKEKFKSLLNY